MTFEKILFVIITIIVIAGSLLVIKLVKEYKEEPQEDIEETNEKVENSTEYNSTTYITDFEILDKKECAKMKYEHLFREE